jgi:hypothetical protein
MWVSQVGLCGRSWNNQTATFGTHRIRIMPHMSVHWPIMLPRLSNNQGFKRSMDYQIATLENYRTARLAFVRVHLTNRLLFILTGNPEYTVWALTAQNVSCRHSPEKCIVWALTGKMYSVGTRQTKCIEWVLTGQNVSCWHSPDKVDSVGSHRTKYIVWAHTGQNVQCGHSPDKIPTSLDTSRLPDFILRFPTWQGGYYFYSHSFQSVLIHV